MSDKSYEVEIRHGLSLQTNLNQLTFLSRRQNALPDLKAVIEFNYFRIYH